MSSKKKDMKSEFLLRIFAVIIALVLLFFVAIYVFVPSFRFEEPKPFSGRFIHNPYQNLSNEDWNYYDFRDSLRNFNIISYEYGFGLSNARYLCMEYKSKRSIDYPFFQNIHFKQYNINCLTKESSLVVPANLNKGFKLREVRHLDNYRLLEVLSSYGNYLEYWDAALSSGRRVNILATSNLNEIKHSVAINADYANKEQVIKSLNDGDFYAISYKDDKDLPKLKDLILTNDTIFVSATKPISQLRFIGQNGKVNDSLNDVNQGFYVFKSDDSYIRIEMYFDDGTIIYLNPLVRHQYQYFFDPTLSEMMTEKTWLMRIIFVCVIIFFIKYLLTNKKEDDEGKGE